MILLQERRGRPRRIRCGYHRLGFHSSGLCKPTVENNSIDIDLPSQHRAKVTLAEMDFDLALHIWRPQPRQVIDQLARIEMAESHTTYTQDFGVSRTAHFKKSSLYNTHRINGLCALAEG